MEMSDASYISDIIMEAPHAFSVGDKSYRLYAPSLGKLMLTQRQIGVMGISTDNLSRWPTLEIIRTVSKYRKDCILLIVYSTAKTKDECFDIERTDTLATEFAESLTDEDIATLLVYILTYDKYDDIVSHYGIDKEQEAMASVMKVKKSGNSIAFGGKTVIGSLIDQACERYGWTVEYAVWGVSYTTLKLMLADRINTVYLSDEEMKKVPARILQKDERVIKGTKENMDIIKSMSWK